MSQGTDTRRPHRETNGPLLLGEARQPVGYQDFRRRTRRLMSTSVRPLALASVSWRSSADANLLHRAACAAATCSRSRLRVRSFAVYRRDNSAASAHTSSKSNAIARSRWGSRSSRNCAWTARHSSFVISLRPTSNSNAFGTSRRWSAVNGTWPALRMTDRAASEKCSGT